MKIKHKNEEIKVPDPPQLPEGYKYVDRGWGFESDGCHYFCASFDLYPLSIPDWFVWDGPFLFPELSEKNIAACSGYEDMYYLEIVKA